jgi:hypothetical protein
MTLVEALVAGEVISSPSRATQETEAVEDVIEVGGVQEGKSSNS